MTLKQRHKEKFHKALEEKKEKEVINCTFKPKISVVKNPRKNENDKYEIKLICNNF